MSHFTVAVVTLQLSKPGVPTTYRSWSSRRSLLEKDEKRLMEVELIHPDIADRPQLVEALRGQQVVVDGDAPG